MASESLTRSLVARALLAATLLAVPSGLVWLRAGQANGIQGPAAPLRGSGLIVGQVVDGSSGSPVGGAIVTLTLNTSGPATGAAPGALPTRPSGNNAAPSQPQRVMANGDGRFVFHDLPHGRASLSASASGYLPGGYGARRPNGPTQSIELRDGQRVGDANIRLWKFGVIGGTVVDEQNDPLVSVMVSLLHQQVIAGQRRLAPNGTTSTDDRGAFRFASLQPGDYFLVVPSEETSVPTSMVEDYARGLADGAAVLMRELNASGAPIPAGPGYAIGDAQLQPGNALSRAGPPPAPDGKLFVYPTTFFPSVLVASQAQLVTVGSGEERADLTIVVRLLPSVRVSGTVRGPDGPTRNFGLRLVPAYAEDWAADNGFEAARTLTDAQGNFTFLGVPAGGYLLKGETNPNVVAFTPAPNSPPVAPVAPRTLWGQTPVSVGDTDVVGVGVVLHEGLAVSGHLEFDGGSVRPAPDRLAQLFVSLTPTDGRNRGPNPPARVTADGQFVTGGYLPGPYTINVPSPGAPWTTKAITLNGHDLLRTPLVLDSDVSGLTVTFTDRPTELTGTVQLPVGSGDLPTVIIVPADYQASLANGMLTHLSRTVRPDASHTFSIQGLPPGDYLVAALPSEAASDWSDPTVLAAAAPQATRLVLGEGERKTVDLRVVTIR